MVLGIPFLSFNNANLQFGTEELIRKIYTTTEAILIVKQVELIDKYYFAKTTLDKNLKTFVIHVVVLKTLFRMTIHLS